MFLGKLLPLFGRNSTAVRQVALVSNEHDGHVGVCVLAGVFKPACEMVERLTSGDVVHEESPSRSSIVGSSDGAE